MSKSYTKALAHFVKNSEKSIRFSLVEGWHAICFGIKGKK